MTAPFYPRSTTLSPSLEESLRRWTEEQEKLRQRLAEQGTSAPAIVTTAPAPSPFVRRMAQTSMQDAGATPDAGEQMREAMRRRRSDELNAAIKAAPIALARAALDPRVAFGAGQEARERVARGAREITGAEGSGKTAQGIGRLALGVGETALNVLPAAGLLGATTKASRIRPLVSTAVGGVGGAATGAALAEPGERSAGAVVGGTVGLVGGQLVQSLRARRALRQTTQGITKDPEMASALKTVQDNIEFRGPVMQAIDNSFSKKWAEKIAQWPDRLIQKTAEGTRTIRQLGERLEARRIVRPSKSPASRLNEAYDSPFRVAQALGGKGIVSPTSFEIIGPSFRDVFAPTQGAASATRDALSYVVARRIVGRGDEMALAMVGGDAKKLDQYKLLVERGQNVPMFQQVETNLKAFTDGLVRYAVESGMWTKGMAERVVASDVLYIPFKRLVEGRKKTVAGSGQLGRTSLMPKKMTGGSEMLENPAEALADYASAVIRRSDAHRLTTSIVESVKQLGDEGLSILQKVPGNEVPRNESVGAIVGELGRRGASPDEAMRVANELTELSVPAFSKDNPYLWVLKNGEKQYYRVESPELVEAMAAFGQQSMLPGLTRALMPLRRLLTTTSTGINAPFFMVTNPSRDIPDVIAKNPGAAQNLLRGLNDSVTELFQTNYFAEEISRAGAGNASLWFVAQNPKAAQRLYAPVSRLQEAAKLGRVATSPLMGIEAVASKIERIPRFAAARAAFDAGMKNWEDVDDAIALAARAFNRGTVDFRVKPGSPAAQFFNDVVPFFGASTKGLARSIDLWQENPGRALAQASATMAATTLEYMYSKKTDREKFVDRMPQERARSLIFGKYKIPLQQEQSVFASLTRYALAQLERDDPEAFKVLAISVANALPPIDVAAVGVPMGLLSNTSFFGPIEPGQLQRLPKEERRFPSTPVTYSALSRGMRGAQEAVGIKSPAILSPREIEFVAREGGLGAFAPAVTAVTDPLARRLMGRAAPEQTEQRSLLQAMSPARGLTVREVPTVTVGSEYYYRERERSQQEAARLRGVEQAIEQSDKSPDAIRTAVLRAGGKEQDARRALLRYARTASGTVNVFTQVDKLVDVLRETGQVLRRNEQLDEKKRETGLNKLRDIENALYREFQKEYASYLSSKDLRDPATVLDAIVQSLGRRN